MQAHARRPHLLGGSFCRQQLVTPSDSRPVSVAPHWYGVRVIDPTRNPMQHTYATQFIHCPLYFLLFIAFCIIQCNPVLFTFARSRIIHSAWTSECYFVTFQIGYKIQLFHWPVVLSG